MDVSACLNDISLKYKNSKECRGEGRAGKHNIANLTTCDVRLSVKLNLSFGIAHNVDLRSLPVFK